MNSLMFYIGFLAFLAFLGGIFLTLGFQSFTRFMKARYFIGKYI